MAKKKARKPAKRKPGGRAHVVTPERLEQIATWHLEGKSITKIALLIGVDESTIRHHLETKIYPRWKERSENKREQLLAEVDHLREVAWERFLESQKDAIKEVTETGPVEEDDDAIKAALKSGGVPIGLIKRAVTRTGKVGESCWLSIVQWCIDFRAKIHGEYAPEKREHSFGDMRIAGLDRPALLKMMHERLSSDAQPDRPAKP